MKNKKGFTLIELLAVITILGILMIVAIPAVSRTIENSRRNTFVSTAKQYANAVKTAFAADEIKCTDGTNTFSATTLTTGKAFWVPINTDGTSNTAKNQPGQYAYDNAKELVNQGGVSSWGNANVSGWVIGVVTQETTDKAGLRQTVKYYIELIDTNNRGINFPSTAASTIATNTATGTGKVVGTLKESDNLERADVLVSGATKHTTKGTITGATTAANNYACYLG